MKRLPLYSLLLVAIWATISCRPESSTTAKKSEEESPAFTPDPRYVPEQEVQTLSLGSTAPDFRLPGIDGAYHSLSDYDDADILMIIFTCNHCPTAQAYEQRMIDITADYADRGVQTVAISPNSPLGVMYEELGYSDLNDDYEAMITRADDMKYNFPYLYDGDDHAASLLYGPAATPHVFIFDRERTLQYVGRLDSKEHPDEGARGEDVRNALDALLAGEKPSLAETKTFGCSTKWAWKYKLKEKVDKEWTEKQVTLKDIDEAGIVELLANDSDKLRLINVWATWCGPCVQEYEEFVHMHRMFGGRDFEFVSISSDKTKRRDKALEILEQKHSALDNYIFTNEDKYALIEAIDPDWNGALPYTMLIEPGGDIAWRYQGDVDFHQLRKTIVEHPMIGRYF